MADWYNSDWDRRKLHVISAQAGAGNSYQVAIQVMKDTGTDGTVSIIGSLEAGLVYCGVNVRDDFGDVRFTSSDGTTPLEYYREDYESGSKAVFWTKMNEDISSADKTIYVYYDNSGTIYGGSPTNVFQISMDDEGTAIGGVPSGWTDISGTGCSVSVESDQSTFGTKSLRISDPATNAWAGIATTLVAGLSSSFCIREMYRYEYNTNPAIYPTLWQFRTTSGNILVVYAYLNSVREMCAYTSSYFDELRDPGLSTVTWYCVESFFDHSNTQLETITVDGIGVNDPNSNLPVSYTGAFATLRVWGFGSADKGSIWLDGFVVRKWTSPEPSHGTWGTEETEAVPATTLAVTFDIRGGVRAFVPKSMLFIHKVREYMTKTFTSIYDYIITHINVAMSGASCPKVADGWVVAEPHDSYLWYLDPYYLVYYKTTENSLRLAVSENRLDWTNYTFPIGTIGYLNTELREINNTVYIHHLTAQNTVITYFRGIWDSGSFSTITDVSTISTNDSQLERSAGGITSDHNNYPYILYRDSVNSYFSKSSNNQGTFIHDSGFPKTLPNTISNTILSCVMEQVNENTILNVWSKVVPGGAGGNTHDIYWNIWDGSSLNMASSMDMQMYEEFGITHSKRNNTIHLIYYPGGNINVGGWGRIRHYDCLNNTWSTETNTYNKSVITPHLTQVSDNIIYLFYQGYSRGWQQRYTISTDTWDKVKMCSCTGLAAQEFRFSSSSSEEGIAFGLVETSGGELYLSPLIYPVRKRLSMIYNVGVYILEILFTSVHKLLNYVTNTISIKYTVLNILDKILELKYTLKEYLTKYLTGIYNVRTYVSNTLSVIYTILKYVQDTLVSTYTIKKYVQPVLTFLYNIMNNLERVLDISYIIKSYLIKVLDIKYTLKVYLDKVLSIPYTIKSYIQRSLENIYNIRTYLGKSLDIPYIIMKYVQQNLTGIYTIKGYLQKPLTIIYNLMANVEKVLDIKYTIKEYLSKVLDIPYTIKGYLQRSLTIPYNLLKYVSRDLVNIYTIKEFVRGILDIRYDIHGYLSKLLSIPYKVKSYVTDTLDIKYIVNSFVQNSLDMIYTIKGYLSKLFSLVYSVKEYVSKPLNIIYSIREYLQLPLILMYNVRAYVEKVLEIIYSMSGYISKLLSIPYNIKSYVQKNVDITYTIKSFMQRTLDLIYSIRSYLTDVTLSLPYNVRNIISTSLSVIYGIKSSIEKALTLVWGNVSYLRKYLVMSYNIFITGMLAVTLDIIHTIKAYTSVPLELVNNIRNNVTKAIELIYSIRKYLSKPLDVIYSIREYLSKSLDMKYMVKSLVDKILSIPYTIKSYLQTILDIPYNVKEYLSKSITSIYNIRGNVDRALILIWNNLSYLRKNLTLVYSITIGVVLQVTLDLLYGIKAYLSTSLNIPYTIRSFTDRLLSLVHNVRTYISKTIDIPYKVGSYVTQLLDIPYKISAYLQKNLSSVYNIRSYLTNIIELIYNVRSNITKSISIPYTIKTYLTKLLDSIYNIRNNISKVLSIDYGMVISILTKTLTLTYDTISTVYYFIIRLILRQPLIRLRKSNAIYRIKKRIDKINLRLRESIIRLKKKSLIAKLRDKLKGR